MSYYLFLDDERFPNQVTWIQLPQVEYWVIVRNYDEFVKVISERGLPKHISFDHDLGESAYSEYRRAMFVDNDRVFKYNNIKEKTGYHAAKWLIDYCIDNELKTFPTFTVHSMNPIGKTNIVSLISSYLRSCGQNPI